MQAFQKQAEAHLAQTVTGLVVSTLVAISARFFGISAKAIWPATTRPTVACPGITIMFVVLGLLTSGA